MEELVSIAGQNGLVLTLAMQNKLEAYVGALRSWNARINLISRKDEHNILERHILHTLTLLMEGPWRLSGTEHNVLDLGTGGGLPGIPYAIARPEQTVLLLDSIQKKITACNEMIETLALTNASAAVSRGEEYFGTNSEKRFDLVITRAVAPLPNLLTWTQKLRTPGATLFALKGGNLEAEMDVARKYKLVRAVQAFPLALKGYGAFDTDQKKVVRVDFHH